MKAVLLVAVFLSGLSAQIPGAAFRATVLTQAEMKRAFGSDTYKSYLVVDVTVTVDPNARLELHPRDFTLKVGETGEYLRSLTPATVALSVDEKNNPPHTPTVQRPVDVVTTSTIGYDSAGSYDPATGKRKGVVYAGSEVAVVPGGSVPRNTASNPKGRGFDQMEAELSAKALPEGAVSRQVSGYLYFGPLKKKGNGAYELEYSNDSGRVTLAIPGR